MAVAYGMEIAINIQCTTTDVEPFLASQVTKTLLEPIITPEMLEANPVRKLFEICQKHKLKVQLIDLWAQNKTCEVLVDNQFRGRGKCLQKKEVALNRAASEVYNEVVNVLGIKS